MKKQIFYSVDLKNICIAFAIQIFFEEESMKKMKFIRLFSMYHWFMVFQCTFNP